MSRDVHQEKEEKEATQLKSPWSGEWLLTRTRYDISVLGSKICQCLETL